MANKTRKDDGAASRAVWLVLFGDAIDRGDYGEAARAQEELRRMGVEVKFVMQGVAA